MKKVSCKDINPATTCDFEATGSTAQDAVGKMLAHVKKEHPEDVAGKNDSEIRTMIEAKVHD